MQLISAELILILFRFFWRSSSTRSLMHLCWFRLERKDSRALLILVTFYINPQKIYISRCWW